MPASATKRVHPGHGIFFPSRGWPGNVGVDLTTDLPSVVFISVLACAVFQNG